MNFNYGSHSPEGRPISGRASWILAPGFAGSALAVGSILAQLFVGFFAILEKQGVWFTLGGAILIFFGISQFVLTVRSMLEIRKGVRLRRSELAIEGVRDERLVDIASVDTASGDSMVWYASVFYAGLIAGLLGAALSIYGLASKLYSPALTGALLASVGFVALACALLSAEEKSDALNG